MLLITIEWINSWVKRIRERKERDLCFCMHNVFDELMMMLVASTTTSSSSNKETNQSKINFLLPVVTSNSHKTINQSLGSYISLNRIVTLIYKI